MRTLYFLEAFFPIGGKFHGFFSNFVPGPPKKLMELFILPGHDVELPGDSKKCWIDENDAFLTELWPFQVKFGKSPFSPKKLTLVDQKISPKRANYFLKFLVDYQGPSWHVIGPFSKLSRNTYLQPQRIQ